MTICEISQLKIFDFDLLVLRCKQNDLEIRINYMQGLLEQKYKQVFEIKIKQERLCQVLQNFNLKIRHLQENQKAIQNSMSMSNILDEVKKYVKGLVKQESTQMIYKFYEKIEVCNKDINRIQYSFKNFEKNMRSQFENLNQKEKLLEKTVSYLNSNQIMKLKSDLEGINTHILLSKSQLMNEINSDRHKFGQIHQKFHAINELLQNGQEKLQVFQETISSLGKKVNEIKNVQFIAKEQMIEEKQNERQRQRQRLPPAQIIKKSRISARRTIDNIGFQRSFDQIKQTCSELKDSKQMKQGKQARMARDGKQNQLHSLQKKFENLQKRVSGIVDSNHNIPTAQNIQNERESIISNQQLMQFNKFDSAQNVDRGQMKTSAKRNNSNLKRGSIRTEENRQSCIQDYGRSNFAANTNNSNDIRKINERLTSLHFKFTLLQQNYDALLSKLNKLGSLQASVQSKIEEAEKIRVDVNTINEIKLRFKQIQTSMQLEEIRYVNHSTYQKQIESIYKRISAIDIVLPVFAKKEEVVSAFTFVQNKIKEIVIVLSNKFEEEKMGAVNKIQHIRCLTCDRQTNLTDLTRPNIKANTRNAQNNRFSYDKTQIAKRIKTEQNQ